MAVAVGGSGGGSSSSSTIDPNLRRCVICTGLSYFKRNKVLALSDSVKTVPHPDGKGSVEFLCFGRKREVFVKNLQDDDSRHAPPDTAFMCVLGESLFLLPGQQWNRFGWLWVVPSSSELPPMTLRGASCCLSAEEFARFDDSHKKPWLGQMTGSSSSNNTAGATTGASPPHPADKPSQSPKRDTVAQQCAQIVANLKPHFVESCAMLHEALLTPQSHVRAAALLSDTVLSWSAHERALRVLHAGSDKAGTILLSTWRKWFGSGGT
jgi:hypothetical protein